MLPTPKAWTTQNFRLPCDITVVFTLSTSQLGFLCFLPLHACALVPPSFWTANGAVFTWTANDSLTGHLITLGLCLSDWAPRHNPFTIARGSWKASHPVSLQQPAALPLPGLVDGHLAGVGDDRDQLEAFLV